MDVHANQSSHTARKDHPTELKERNARDAENVQALTALDPRICGDVCADSIILFDGDAIVNAANEALLGGGGVDEAIHRAAGPRLRDECEKMPVSPGTQARCMPGQARITRGFDLPAKFVIHAVAPYLSPEDEPQPNVLRSCYRASLELALNRKLKSVAFPCLATGYYGYPAVDAATIALTTIHEFLQQHKPWDVTIHFYVFNDLERIIYRRLMPCSVPGTFLPWASVRPKKIFGRPLSADESPVVLVIDQDGTNHWNKAFQSARWHGKPVTVEQTAWHNIVSCQADMRGGLQLDLEPSFGAAFGSSMGKSRSVAPHLIMVRNFARGAKAGSDLYLNYLLAFQHCNVPCVNGVESLISLLERGNAIAAGHRVERQIPCDFQMIPIDFYANLREISFPSSASRGGGVVAKVGSAHAGDGKMLFRKGEHLGDFRGLIALHREYVTLEPFLDNKQMEYRLHVMGSRVCCYSRESMTHEWKANVGEGKVVDLPVTPRHLRIVEEMRKLFPHFTVFGADMMVTKDGQEYCLELNDSSIGFYDKQKDQEALVEVVMHRLREIHV